MRPGGALLAIAALSLALAACVDQRGMLVIVQNQSPEASEGTCTVPVEQSDVARTQGVLDLDTGELHPYYAYPLVENRLPSRLTAGTADANTVYLRGARVTLVPPAGLAVPWIQGCAATFEQPHVVAINPGEARTLTIEAIMRCHVEQIRALFQPGGLPSDLSQEVFFTAEIRAYGTRPGGDDVDSDPLPLPIRVCVGCLQTGFTSHAQFNYPTRPRCADVPKPNPYHGNPCNIAQDFGPLLCCIDETDRLVCPAPDA